MPLRNKFDAAVYIMNLPYDVESNDLKEYISNSLSKSCNRITTTNKGTAVAYFSEVLDAISACTKLNATLYKDRKMYVKLHKFSSLVSKPPPKGLNKTINKKKNNKPFSSSTEEEDI